MLGELIVCAARTARISRTARGELTVLPRDTCADGATGTAPIASALATGANPSADCRFSPVVNLAS